MLACCIYKSNSLRALSQPRDSSWHPILVHVSGDLSLILVLLRSIPQTNLKLTSLILLTSSHCQRPHGDCSEKEEGIDKSRSGGSKEAWKAETRAATQGYFSDCFYITFGRDSNSDILSYGTIGTRLSLVEGLYWTESIMRVWTPGGPWKECQKVGEK